MMEDFDIEKQSEPSADYVSWSLNNFKVEDVTDHSVLCNLEPWDTDSCGATAADIQPDHKNDNTNNLMDNDVKMDLKDVKIEVNAGKMPREAEMQPQMVMPEKIDPEALISEDKLSTVDLGHICEIVGNKDDPEHMKQFICLYCGLQLSWTHLCFHMKFGHNNHDKVKLCKRFDCEYHTKMKIGSEPDACVPPAGTAKAARPGEGAETSNGGPGAAVEPAPACGELRRCPACSFTTSKKAGLRDHIRHSHPREDGGEGGAAGAAGAELHKCLICGFQTKYKYGLKKHAKKHSKLTLHKCPCCDYSTILPLLLEHIKFKHSNEQLAWTNAASGSVPLAPTVGGEPGQGAPLLQQTSGTLDMLPLAEEASIEILPALQLPQ